MKFVYCMRDPRGRLLLETVAPRRTDCLERGPNIGHVGNWTSYVRELRVRGYRVGRFLLAAVKE